MTNCNQQSFAFPVCKRRSVEANFQGGDITSDGGVLLLRQVDRRLGLSAAVAQALDDPRRQASCQHDAVSLIRQRLYALALGYEDLNDHQSLRTDVAMQTAVERESVLASSATLCRWENRADREAAWKLHEVLVDQFMASFKRAPKKLVLDFDATDDVVHGKHDCREAGGRTNQETESRKAGSSMVTTITTAFYRCMYSATPPPGNHYG